MANPPIHIIVEEGRVTLTGVVNSDVERMLARSLATGRGELSVKNESANGCEVRTDYRDCSSLPFFIVHQTRPARRRTAALKALANSHSVR